MVTQCPIAPNNAYDYRFTVPDQAGARWFCTCNITQAYIYLSGTYWYHSHHMTQLCDGLRGPMVIYDKSDPFLGSKYDVDNGQRSSLRRIQV